MLSRIFSSHSASFLPKFTEATNDRGADVVINTSQGEFMQAAWKCVAMHGKMIELGKRNILAGIQLDMSLFGGSRSFCHLDFATLQDLYPSLLSEVFSKYE
ncbi:hypothetical protein LTS15_009477 [Exophiala xenobiotica]|nr:hypothetical protein LTS15_009477 [Exophiala xenobiotica]